MWIARAGVLSSGQRTTPLLDLVTGADFAYSTRRLRNAYTGFALRVRAGTTNAEADVAFDGLGFVTANSTVTITTAGTSGFSVGAQMTFSAFYGSQSVFVKTLYDQSGTSKNLTQATNSAQPICVLAGTMITIGGRLAMRGASGTGIGGSIGSRSTTTFSLLVVTQRGTDSNNYGRTVSFTVGTAQDFALTTSFNMNNVGISNRLAFERNNVYSTATVVNATNYVVTGIWTGTNQEIRVNNSTAVSAASSGSFTFDTLGILAHINLGDPTTGLVSEVIGWNSALDATNRQVAERHAGTAFGINVN